MAELHDVAAPVILVHAVIFRDRAFLDHLGGSQDALEHHLATGRHEDVRAPASRDFKVRKCRGDAQFIFAEAEIQRGSDHHGRRIAERHRDRQRARAARHHREMVVGRDADEGAVAAEGLETSVGQVRLPGFDVARGDDSRGDVGPGLVLEEGRDRQRAQVGLLLHYLLARRAADLLWPHGHADRGDDLSLQLDRRNAKAERDALTRAEEVAHDAHPASRDVLEAQRRSGAVQVEVGRDLVFRLDAGFDRAQCAARLEQLEVLAKAQGHARFSYNSFVIQGEETWRKPHRGC